ncbi:hypothetical protein GGX14DRAFT_381775 [Mycena pura]|uniref:Uncharacterized protein n=1 Tax=Mycena pura TaxID=153505 RepID=A0AAD6UUW1_9AGAR|nr:hypothetical protein GGX14DRAFT_381775 [Mycena pura]
MGQPPPEHIPEPDAPLPANVGRRAEQRFTAAPTVKKFGGAAGAPTAQKSSSSFEEYEEWLAQFDDNPWRPYKSRIDWAVARWGKLRGSTSTAFSDLLAIDGLPEALGLSYRTSAELNEIIDRSLPRGRPGFQRQEIVVSGEAFDVYFSDIMGCVRALYGDPEFANCLIFAPERHYADPDETIRLWSDMHTGKWWWSTQKVLEQRKRGATILPIIISTDKTQTTTFRNKSAYPVYMTLGNIPKGIRRKPSRQAYILIGYLPTTRLEHIKVAAARRRALANLYHACMRKILDPLRSAGLERVKMASGDGVVRRCHPVLASFSGDYPEQCLVTGCKSGECPTCPVPPDELGDLESLYEPRDLDAVLEALALADGDATEFTRACVAAGIKPIHRPFWEDLPFVNIFICVTPDVLHQLFQGVLKHVVSWIKDAYGPIELDARCRRMPPNHNVRLFAKGITSLSRVSGTEHSQVCRILIGLITDLPLPGGHSPARLIRAVRAILDFIYLQYPIHSSETLARLTDALKRFHQNKSIFIDLGIRTHFNIPKLHNIAHYPMFIRLLGTQDNFNTEHTERLHIDFTKDAYRATNRKDEYLQMTLWLERKEKVLRHEKFIRWVLAGRPRVESENTTWRLPIFIQHGHHQLTKLPSAYGVNFGMLTERYGAEFFRDAFARFVVAFKNPTLTSRQMENLAADYILPFQSVSVYHKIKFWNEDPFGREDSSDALDVIHVKPGYTNKHGRMVGGRFDIGLVNEGTGGHIGVSGYRVAQVRAVFSLTPTTLERVFPDEKPSRYLAYVEWFSKFHSAPQANHGLYRVTRPVERTASIVPVEHIRRSLHLYPEFGAVAPREWTSGNVLELCQRFYVSPWSDRHSYVTVV